MGKAESKTRVTIKDVAKASGVSIATVSYVLNNKPGQSISEDTRKKVLQFANLLGYECNIMAKYLATGKTNTVSVVIKDIAGIASAYYLKLITELSSLMFRQNLELKIVDYADGLARSASCDAYITLALSEEQFRAFADTKYVPVVAIDSVFDDFLFYRINDNFECISKAAKQELGAEQVTLLTFELPEECLKEAERCFDGVVVVRSTNDILSLDRAKHYVTVSKFISDNAPFPVKLESASFALKASAAVGAVIKAINRTQSSTEEHNILV